MTLSKADWRAVRPDKLRNLDAAKLMEALRRKPGDSIEDWQDFLQKCDDLQATLDRTPRMLLKTMTEPFRAALKVWYGDIDDLRRDGKKALDELGHAYVDAACSRVALKVEIEVQAFVTTVTARIKAEAKRAAADRDRRTYEELCTELKRLQEMIRVLRRQKMKSHLREDQMAQDLIRAKHVRMRKLKLTCDPMLKALMKAIADTQKAYDKLMGVGPRLKREVPP